MKIRSYIQISLLFVSAVLNAQSDLNTVFKKFIGNKNLEHAGIGIYLCEKSSGATVYELNKDFTIALSTKRTVGEPRRPPLVTLDPDHYQFIADLEDHFPHGAPSLIDCAPRRPF